MADDGGLRFDKEPEKFIRTYASDAAAAQKGQIPGLAPLPETPPSTAAASAPAGASEKVSELPRAPEAPSFAKAAFIPPRMTPAERLVAPSTLPLVVEAPPPPAPPALPPVPPPGPSPIHTYPSDFSEHVEERGASEASVLAAELDRPARPEAAPGGSKRTGILFVVGGALLLVIAGGGVFLAYRYAHQVSAPVAITPAVFAPIFVDERQEVAGTGADLVRAIEASLAKPLSRDGVRLLYREAAAGGGDIFSALAPSAPSILLRNIVGARSIAGVVAEGGVQSPFFILAVSSYNATFAGMYAWEPNMARDLADLFPPYPLVPAPAAPTVSAPPVFRDEVVANHDVRVLRDAAGRSVLLYGYADPNTLVIARGDDAYAELLSRLSTSRTQRE